MVRRERGHPELHLSTKTKESPSTAGPHNDSQGHEHQESVLGPMITAPYKTSSGRDKHLVKWTHSMFKGLLGFFFHATGK